MKCIEPRAHNMYAEVGAASGATLTACTRLHILAYHRRNEARTNILGTLSSGRQDVKELLLTINARYPRDVLSLGGGASTSL